MGRFLHVGDEVVRGLDKRMGRMLVEVDITKGLLEEIEIEWRDKKFHHALDYWGLPLRCAKCREVGHLWTACKLSSLGSVSKESSSFYGEWSSEDFDDIEG